MNNDNNNPEQQPFGLWNRTAIEKKTTPLDQVKTMANEKIQEIMNNEVVIKVGKEIENLKQELKEGYDKLDQKAQNVLHEQKAKMNLWIKQKIEMAIIRVLEKTKPILLESILDPYMCDCLSKLIEDVFEEVWPDIKEEILLQIRVKYADPYELVEFPKPKLCCIEYPWFWFKVWYLYVTQPFDKSIFEQLHWYSWWLVFIVQLIPFYGIQAFIYVFVFLFIDKQDEYQLIRFILAFKSMQFISIGLIGTMVGYFTFYSCAVVSTVDKSYQDCKEEGPAIFLNFWSDIAGFLLQLLLVWLAIILLKCSKIKGQIRFKHVQVAEQQINNKIQKQSCCLCCTFNDRGGRLYCFMLYDLICFLGCVALFLGLSVSDGERMLWQYKSTMYLAKTVYGLLSFPFLVFRVPGLTWLLTRSHGTGYDCNGNCVPLVSNLQQYHLRNKQQKKPYDPKYVVQREDFDVMEGVELMDELVN
ncbi:unnamed protein product [Paramecium primaurelia]|uniref:Transmembrane protein n=1 Tax=Paramecium primaurelia TaxID=5886 RepID=A0A8S1KF46_PARPR|nr:unnamed protein product [Paramecium primaurelia]